MVAWVQAAMEGATEWMGLLQGGELKGAGVSCRDAQNLRVSWSWFKQDF